ncbi:antioxidant, AhpC/TSA family [Sphingobacterium spiritivorum ATCC 33300]|uniref:Antioxidant, AhpC/TSA family n=1 Tax=Sphingobacterium spiritivorum ATCC 33300 TaxID=525372 RepID=C2FZM0_SPHSI|nr:antioxidant, AhpC/TSA family [Sphingobacterium spiritivorum ATCC 33300]QQS97195.1 redoxin domain-containing protein [Sphingobacterium spiritivorum]
MRYIIIVIFLLFGKNLTGAQLSLEYSSINAVKTLQNKDYDFLNLNNKPHVFIFYSSDCPLSQKYTLTISNLYNKYTDKINFVGVFPGKEHGPEEYKNFKDKYNINYMLIKDEKFNLTSHLKATVTPEVFLLDKSGKIMYHGAIDDWAVKLGKTKQQPTINYLENAIESLLNNKNIQSDYIKPIGCYIEQ